MITYTKKNFIFLVLSLTILIFIISNLVIFPFISSLFNIQKLPLFSSCNVYSKTIPISQLAYENEISTEAIKDVLNVQTNTQNDNKLIKIINEQSKNETTAQESKNNIEETESQNKKVNIEGTSKNENSNRILEDNAKKENKEENKTETQRQVVKDNQTNKWRIQIPKLNLDVHIMEGTSSDILLKAVGHFEETSKWQGNVGLAAHNRGYQCNFFQKIKNLNTGDEIIYTTTNGKKVYKVETNKVIVETDWSYLEKTTDNRITLITCEENRTGYRRCVQAIEIANYKI